MSDKSVDVDIYPTDLGNARALGVIYGPSLRWGYDPCDVKMDSQGLEIVDCRCVAGLWAGVPERRLTDPEIMDSLYGYWEDRAKYKWAEGCESVRRLRNALWLAKSLYIK